ncbi:UDP-2-acetamido-2,6-beta-L-arabino-hexul-4-ose reductase [Alishewanella sp. HL-SH05]|uniref:UDP-2-acetamido-2,6-beta-L-arabino-hexul-4-ose reductase n=1 Tax=Alishewanella sp. HL-SH05 TaxID=3461145 RepID=UPI00404329F5
MKVLVTGADGFVGKNLCISLMRNTNIEILKFTRESAIEELPKLVAQVEFIFHLAGINRPVDENEFAIGNADLTATLCEAIKASGRKIPLLLSSSTQAERTNAYGKSKLQAEMHLLNLHMQTGNKVYIYRLPNVFGKWCKPNYNSAVATFCHNISRGLPIQVNDPSTQLTLVHIGAVVSSFIEMLYKKPEDKLYVNVEPVYKVTLGELVEQLHKFRDSRESLITEPVGEGFTRVLYATYISYIPPDKFNYGLTKHEDQRGCFVEMLKTRDSGQFSFFTAHPGVTRGGHYHHVKTEKFLVIKGKARFGFRHIVTDEVIEIITSGEMPEVVETVPGWSHDVTNIGEDELVVMLWANENFDRERPDTVAYKV